MIRCFNSSLVRLAECTRQNWVGLKYCFNSSLVRLAVNNSAALSKCEPSFNSSLVRLAAFNPSRYSTAYVVSIPVWYDWQDICRCLYRIISLFQFQFGTIGSKFKHSVGDQYVSFQFQFGTIGRSNWSGKLPWITRFNSSLVRLAGCRVFNRIRIYKMFQFQFGTIGRLF